MTSTKHEREQMELNEQLINSAKEGKVGQTMELIEAGADVNAVNKEGKTPLCIAAMEGYRGVVELLLSEGANVNADVFAENSFNFALRIGVKVKVFNKRNMGLVERRGQTPLHIPVVENHTKGVELLLNRGADVNAVNKKGETPLHIAVAQNHTKGVELLLNRGADINAVNKEEETPLRIAMVYPLIDIAKILIKYIMLCDYHTTKPGYIVNNSELSEFWDLCKNEVSGRLSNSTISVYQFLREADENKLLRYLPYKNSDLRKYLEEKQYEKDFHIYANIITGQLHKAMKRKDLLYRSDKVMNHSVDLKDFRQEKKTEITNYLTNEELRNVIRAPFSIPSQNFVNLSAEQLQRLDLAR